MDIKSKFDKDRKNQSDFKTTSIPLEISTGLRWKMKK